VLADLHAEGHREVAVVPLLLGSAFHARVDIPSLIHEVTDRLPLLRVSVSAVLGPDALLESAALARLAETGAAPDPTLGIALTGVGSAHAPANTALTRVAERWHVAGGFAAVTHAFATTGPDVASAITRLRARGAGRFAVAPWFLAPGLLLDRVQILAKQAAPGVVVADPLGAHPLIAQLVLQRYAETSAAQHRAA
ncbi:MAG: sirohydrochlorin chelatase, partial [Haloechinothrix sp.]